MQIVSLFVGNLSKNVLLKWVGGRSSIARIVWGSGSQHGPYVPSGGHRRMTENWGPQ